jgi:Leucine-rich repeat (LRR) protein
MKKVLFLLMFPIIGFSQYTFIPDHNFEQALIDFGYDDVIDGKVLNANINSVDSLFLEDKNISDLIGVEAFTALTFLNCNYNQLTSLDVSKNTALTDLDCAVNQLTNLDVSQNTALSYLYCDDNKFDCDALKAKYGL